MITLSKFTPAETLILTEGTSPTLRQLLKFTFIDLFFKQVIKTESTLGTEYNNLGSADEKHVIPGKNFYSYNHLPHESVFTKHFEKYPNTKLLFRHVVQLSYKSAFTKNKYLSLLCKSSSLEGLIKQSYLQKLSGNFTLTESGKTIKQKLNNELNELELTLPVLIEKDKEKGIEILKKINGNIFLLVNIPFEKWDAIDKELLMQVNRDRKDKNENSGGCGGTGCSGCGSWNSYNEYSNSFDSGCGSSDGGSTSGGGSGCSSGDSGCSGCGGGGD